MRVRQPVRKPLAVALATVCTVVMGVVVGMAGPAVASPSAHRVAMVAVPPQCQIASPEKITGATFSNNQFLNGTWTYATGVACSGSALADIALYQELDLNGTKVDSKLKGFTGVPRQIDAIQSVFHCAICNGVWVFRWGQVLKAPSGFMFTAPPSGCALVENGLYQLCVQTQTVNLVV